MGMCGKNVNLSILAFWNYQISMLQIGKKENFCYLSPVIVYK